MTTTQRRLEDNAWWMGILGAILLISILACGGGDDDVTTPPESSLDTCGGIAGLTCDDPDEVCVYEQSQDCGAADQMGTCQRRPTMCPQHYDPVCGCDGKTYGNACMATAAGVSIESQGECSTLGQLCGTRGAAPCAAGEVCIYEESAQCGRADHPGTCQAPSQMCPRHYDPVCGCDGKTYSNECTAHAQGVSVDYVGECQTDLQVCGTLGADPCAVDEFCLFAVDDQCGFADQGGICAPRPQACTMHYDPVCGCDGQTYGNACTANSHGVSVAHDGPCNAAQ